MHEQKTWQFVIPASLTANGMDSFSSIGILLRTKPKTKQNKREKKKEKKTHEIHGVDKIMEKSTQKSSNSEGVSDGCALVLVQASLYELRVMLSKLPSRYILPH